MQIQYIMKELSALQIDRLQKMGKREKQTVKHNCHVPKDKHENYVNLCNLFSR